MSKYPVIIFEGIEASGKTTNINIVAKYLKRKKKNLLNLGNLVDQNIQKL